MKVGAHRCWTESKLLILTEAMHCNKTELLMMAWKYSNVLHLIGSAVLRIIILLPCPVKSFSLMIICDWWLLNRLFGVGDKCHSVLLWRMEGLRLAGRLEGARGNILLLASCSRLWQVPCTAEQSSAVSFRCEAFRWVWLLVYLIYWILQFMSVSFLRFIRTSGIWSSSALFHSITSLLICEVQIVCA